jgi:hypothetical protein
MSFIERIGKNKVGFYCWKLFIINYFRGYEVRNVHIFENETKFFGATIEEGLLFRHKIYMYLCSSEEGDLTQGGSRPRKQGWGRAGEGQKPIFIGYTSRASNVRGVTLEGHTSKWEGQNMIRGDHKRCSKIFQYMQYSDVH